MKLVAETFSFKSEAPSPGAIAEALELASLGDLDEKEKSRRQERRAMAKEMAEVKSHLKP